MANEFPRPDLPLEEKFKKDEKGIYIYAKNALDFAINNHQHTRKGNIKKMNDLYKKFNGTHIGFAVQYLNKTYGKKNAMKYIDYRLGRPKIEKLIGEFTERPINTTVFSINKEAQIKKLDSFYLAKGLYDNKEEVQELRGKYGQEAVANGMPIPTEDPQQTYWSTASSKTKNEITMQLFINHFIKTRKTFSYSLTSCYRDVIIAGEAHGKVGLDKSKKPFYREIDPRDRIFLENDRDHFCHESPFHGDKQRMFLSQIISTYNLNAKEIEALMQEGQNSDFEYEDSYERTNANGAEQSFWVYTLQWKSYDPIITKNSPAKNKTLPTDDYKVDIPVEKYIEDHKEIKKDIAKNNYTVDIQYKETLWEGTRIGRSLYKKCGPKKNIMGSYDEPFGTKYEYVSYLSNTVNGMRISIKELLDAIEEQYNIVRFQINRELAKMKGMTLAYNRAFMPKGKTMKDVLYRLVNDGLLDYDSSEDGNISGETIDPKDAIKAIDLGASASLQMLIMLAQNLEATAETISGISNQRIGDIKASETATNAQSAIASSKTITEPINTGFDIFITEIVTLIMEQSKIAALLDPEWGETIVGPNGMEFLKISKSIALDDFANYLNDYRKEKEVRQNSMHYAEMAINSGELKVEDLMDAGMEETISGAIAVLRTGTKRIRDAANAQVEEQNKIKREQIESAERIAKENREDLQQHEKDKIILQGQVDMGKETQSSANKNIIEQKKSQKNKK